VTDLASSQAAGLARAGRGWHGAGRGLAHPVVCAEMAGGAVAAGYAFLCAEGVWARMRIHAQHPPLAEQEGEYGHGDGEPITLVMLGDSLAVGIGADHPSRTPGAILASGLAAIAGRPVRLRVLARGGARTRDLPGQLEAARGLHPTAAVIVVGGNDITHAILPGPHDMITPLRQVIAELRATGAAVLVATCPDIGTVRPIPWPLRSLAHRASRALAREQATVALAEGARTVSLGYMLGPLMSARPGELFSADHFHPSAEAYEIAARMMIPPLAAALQLRPGRLAPHGRLSGSLVIRS